MTWMRLEGAARDPKMSEGLAARIADPLWTLARQWQVGEFHGEDAASPIIVTADVAFTPVTVFAPGKSGTGEVIERADADRPLEVMIEQESADDDLRLGLEYGWILLRSLAEAGLPAASLDLLREQARPQLPKDDGLDPIGQRQLQLIASRSLDGARLAERLSAKPNATDLLLADIKVPATLRAGVRAIFRDWQTAVQDFVRQPKTTSSWRSGPLEYQFRVAAPLGTGEMTLEASEYRGGTLDWYHVRRPQKAKPLGASGASSQRQITVLPTPLRFHGMPASRFWAIEDETVSFGDLAAGPEDLVRAIVGAFSAVYADDWLIVPCQLPAGSLARITSLTVYDDYGKTHSIPAAAVLDGPSRVWRFFEVEGDDGPDAPLRKDRQAPLMLLAPALPDTEEGPPLERVDLLRDQVSNLAWAIERRVVGASGRSVDRDAPARSIEIPETASEWSYQAYTPMPQNWIPFVPVRLENGNSAQVRLRRARLHEQTLPMGKLLEPERPLRIREEAIGDAGLRIDRRYQRARDADGRVHLWIGRRVRTGAWPAAARFSPDRLIRPNSPNDPNDRTSAPDSK